MTEPVLSVPTSTPVAAPTATAAGATPTTPGVLTETQTGGEFQAALAMQMQGSAAPGVTPAPIATGSTPVDTTAILSDEEFLSTLSGQPEVLPVPDGEPLTVPVTTAPDVELTAVDVVEPVGRELPMAGQTLPLPTPNLSPTDDKGKAVSGSRPRLNPAPIANAVAQAALRPGQDRPVVADVPAAATGQHDVLTTEQVAAMTADTSAQKFSLSTSAGTTPGAVHGIATPSPLQTPGAVVANPVPAIPIPLAQTGWDQALGQRVQWLVGQQMQSAELRITPPNLGPIEVRINLGQDQQTQINFTSPHAVVREAIEAALPRLRDMLGENGVNLGNVDISQHSFAEQRRQASPHGVARDNVYGHERDALAIAGAPAPTDAGRAGLGLVDYFV